MIHILRIPGKALSITSMSLPSRFSIRPLGVVSKNDIGLRRTLFMIFSKTTLEAITDPIAKDNDVRKLAKAKII